MTYKTKKRELLLDFLKENSQSSFTVEELCQSILPDGNAKSTVYRLVSKLCKEGTLKKLMLGDAGKFSYQYVKGAACHEHLHLKCKDCGRLIHLDAPTSHFLENELIKKEGFILDADTMLFGVCSECCVGEKQ
jgi:Fur family ferric uptake transcriptional regulator